ncbi:MAG TPA: hypothetical protein VFE05_02225 [Longimicrobiaceae bacterium]|jgi:hypothetical protein|nr:hypothetical protein [Longimicrobiaceae bacterium]
MNPVSILIGTTVIVYLTGGSCLGNGPFGPTSTAPGIGAGVG